MTDRSPTSAPKNVKPAITQAQLKELLHYDQKTGVFTWLKAISRRVHVGMVAGTPNGNCNGHIQIAISKRKYLAHRLAFLYMTGSFSEMIVDHKDLNKQNNAWSNLRECNGSQNQSNKESIGNSTGYKGVSREFNKFNAYIKKNKKTIYLGLFKTPQEAHAACCAASNKFHGEFGRTT
jgi:hypothetical protein